MTITPGGVRDDAMAAVELRRNTGDGERGTGTGFGLKLLGGHGLRVMVMLNGQPSTCKAAGNGRNVRAMAKACLTPARLRWRENRGPLRLLARAPSSPK